MSVLMLANARDLRLDGVKDDELNEDFIVVLTDSVPMYDSDAGNETEWLHKANHLFLCGFA
jgi:hypothetical protein